MSVTNRQLCSLGAEKPKKHNLRSCFEKTQWQQKKIIYIYIFFKVTHYDRFSSSCFLYLLAPLCWILSVCSLHMHFQPFPTLLYAIKRLLIITSITCLPCLNFPLCSANGEWRKDEKGIYSLGFCPKGSTWTTEKLISFDSYLHSALHGIAPSPLLGGLGTVKEPLFLTWATKLFLVVSFM